MQCNVIEQYRFDEQIHVIGCQAAGGIDRRIRSHRSDLLMLRHCSCMAAEDSWGCYRIINQHIGCGRHLISGSSTRSRLATLRRVAGPKAVATSSPKLNPGQKLALGSSPISSTRALQYSIASWATAIGCAARKPPMFSAVGSCCLTRK
jgi:hypothetical protein